MVEPEMRVPARTHADTLLAVTSGVMNVSHVADHRLELRQLPHALEVFADLSPGPIGFNVLGASPLPVIDHASTVAALVKAGRDIARLPAEQLLRALFEDLNQLFLTTRFHG